MPSTGAKPVKWAAMPRPAFQRNLARLALLAMLLLALAPSVSRLLAAQPSSPEGWTQLCSLQGLKWAKLPQGPAGDTKMPGHGSGDCAYCPLARGLDSAVAVVALPFVPQAFAPVVAPSVRIGPSRWIYPSGLGSRGPPRLS
jgi:hypothetical protein